MARKAKVQNQFLMPTEATMDLLRKRLSHFPPYETKKLLADARALRSEAATLDDAIFVALHKQIKLQVATLVNQLGPVFS